MPRRIRSGRRIQLKRLLQTLNQPKCEFQTALLGVSPKPTIISIEIIKRPVKIIPLPKTSEKEVRQWSVIPILLTPVIYPGNVPYSDPRRKTYILKRRATLYPIN